jgi:hypothetical protein
MMTAHAYDRMRVRHAVEGFMLTKTVLETTTTMRLVELCKKVTESAQATALESDECGQFIKEWRDLRNKAGNESGVSRLRNKMIGLLSVTANRLAIQ